MLATRGAWDKVARSMEEASDELRALGCKRWGFEAVIGGRETPAVSVPRMGRGGLISSTSKDVLELPKGEGPPEKILISL